MRDCGAFPVAIPPVTPKTKLICWTSCNFGTEDKSASLLGNLGLDDWCPASRPGIARLAMMTFVGHLEFSCFSQCIEWIRMVLLSSTAPIQDIDDRLMQHVGFCWGERICWLFDGSSLAIAPHLHKYCSNQSQVFDLTKGFDGFLDRFNPCSNASNKNNSGLGSTHLHDAFIGCALVFIH